MTKRAYFAALAVFALAASAADAQSARRAWVSGHGTDAAGCGAPTAPCRSLQWAHDHIVAAGGEIDVLDPAGYGALAISKAISIINDGVGTAGLQAASGAVVRINAGGGDTVRLRGLNIEGLGGAATGIDFASGGSLLVADSTVDGAIRGIEFEPSGLGAAYISNVRVTDCAASGVEISPRLTNPGTVQVTLDRLEVTGTFGGRGVLVYGGNNAAGVVITMTLADSVVAGNQIGVEGLTFSVETPVYLTVRNATLANNGTALFANQNSTVAVTRSTLSGNQTGFAQDGTATLNSFGDNSVVQNNSDGVTPTPIAFQ